MYGIFAYIYLDTYIWPMCMVNVGKYTSPMDGMGFDRTDNVSGEASIAVTFQV